MLAFVDESGIVHRKDDSPFYTLVAVTFQEWEISKFDRKIYEANSIFREHYDDLERENVEIKSKKFITNRIFKPNMNLNLDFIEKIFDAIRQSQINIVRVVGERPDVDIKWDIAKLPRQYTLLVNGLEDYARKSNIKNISVVFDNIDDGDAKNITKKFSNLVHKAALKNQGYEHITAWPMFVSSQVVPGIQIADIVAGVIRHMYCLHFGRTEAKNYSPQLAYWIHEKYEIIKSKFSASPNSFPLISKDEIAKISSLDDH